MNKEIGLISILFLKENNMFYFTVGCFLGYLVRSIIAWRFNKEVLEINEKCLKILEEIEK